MGIYVPLWGISCKAHILNCETNQLRLCDLLTLLHVIP